MYVFFLSFFLSLFLYFIFFSFYLSNNLLYLIVTLFLKFFTDDIWRTLLEAVNRHMASHRSTASKRKRSVYRDSTMREMQRFYAYIMYVENTYGNSTKQLGYHLRDVSYILLAFSLFSLVLIYLTGTQGIRKFLWYGPIPLQSFVGKHVIISI